MTIFKIRNLGIILAVCGAVIVAGFLLVPLKVTIAGGILLVLGLGLALYKRKDEPIDERKDERKDERNDGAAK